MLSCHHIYLVLLLFVRCTWSFVRVNGNLSFLNMSYAGSKLTGAWVLEAPRFCARHRSRHRTKTVKFQSRYISGHREFRPNTEIVQPRCPAGTAQKNRLSSSPSYGSLSVQRTNNLILEYHLKHFRKG